MNKKVFNIPFKGFYTHCYTFGDIHNKTPLIILHGGPGGCDERYEVLEKLADRCIPLIFYDQLGCGYSRVPKGNDFLWTFETYLDELDNVISYFKLDNFYVLGHSWGGMLALEYITKRHNEKLKKLVLFSTLPSTKIWNDEHLKMIENYPNNEKDAILKEFNGEAYDKKNYKLGIRRFYNEHVGKKKDRKYIPNRKRFPKTNKEIYEKMWGKSELFGTGTLANYDVIEQLEDIKIPTLIISGEFDESTQVMNKLMNEKIKGSKWVMLPNAHHGGYNEEPDLTLDSIEKFIK